MSNDRAVEKFLTNKAKIDEALRRLTELSENPFEVNPEDIHYRHVSDLACVAQDLSDITDYMFSEGECAE